MNNSFNRLNSVVAKPKKYIAAVDTVNTNGTTTVTHSDGSKEVVLGNNVASGDVYISDGVIVGQAAQLTYSVIEV